jgi:hypothetical protein
MAHQERMLGHPLRAWLGMKLAESVCKAPSLPPTSSAIGFSPRQLLIETIINRVEIEFSIIRLFPKPLRMALVPARLRQLNEGLFLQKELGIPDIRANLLRRRGLAYHLMSQYRLAEEDLLNAKIMFSSLGRVETGIINVLGGLADLYYGMQDFTKARQCSLEAIGLATGEGGIAGLAKHFRRLARIEMLEGRPDKARLMIVQMKKAGGTIEGAINRIRYAGPFWLISLIIRLSTLKIKRKGRSL